MNDYLLKALTYLAIVAIFYILFGAYQYNFVEQYFSKTSASKALVKYIKSASIVLALYISIFIALPSLLNFDRTIYNILDRIFIFLVSTIVYLFIWGKFAIDKLSGVKRAFDIPKTVLYREYQSKWQRLFWLLLIPLWLLLAISYFKRGFVSIDINLEDAVYSICMGIVNSLLAISYISLFFLPQLQLTSLGITRGIYKTSWREIRAYKWGKKIEDVFSTSEGIHLYLLTNRRMPCIFAIDLPIPASKQEEVDNILRQYITEVDR